MILSKKYYKKNKLIRDFFYFLNTLLRTSKNSKLMPLGKAMGMPELMRNDKGTLLCDSCMKCEKACPAACIFITATEGSGRPPVEFQIDLAKCIYCGECEVVCPIAAIKMSDSLPPPFEKGASTFLVAKGR